MFTKGVVITTEGLWLQQKVGDPNRFVGATEGMCLQQQGCIWNRMFVDRTEGL